MQRITATFLIAVLILGVVAYFAMNGSEDKTVYVPLSASWPYGYADVHELATHSDLVIVGTAVSASSTEDRPRPEPDIGIIFTDFTTEVEEVLKGDASIKSVVIHQTGGRVGNILQEIDSDPIIEIGQRYVLFLKKSPTTERYMVIGGPRDGWCWKMARFLH